MPIARQKQSKKSLNLDQHLDQHKATSVRLIDLSHDVIHMTTKIDSNGIASHVRNDKVDLSLTLSNENLEIDSYYCLILPTFPDFKDLPLTDSVLAEMLSCPKETVRLFASLMEKLRQENEIDDEEPSF